MLIASSRTTGSREEGREGRRDGERGCGKADRTENWAEKGGRGRKMREGGSKLDASNGCHRTFRLQAGGLGRGYLVKPPGRLRPVASAGYRGRRISRSFTNVVEHSRHLDSNPATTSTAAQRTIDEAGINYLKGSKARLPRGRQGFLAQVDLISRILPMKVGSVKGYLMVSGTILGKPHTSSLASKSIVLFRLVLHLQACVLVQAPWLQHAEAEAQPW